jgi:class 3 adenylate cyclase
VTESGIDFCRIKIHIADPSLASKHKSVINNWLSFSEAYVQITTGQSARIELLKSVYDGDECIEYLVHWQNPLFSKPKLIGMLTALLALGLSFSTIVAKLGTAPTMKLAAAATAFGGLVWLIGKSIYFKRKYEQIHDSFAEFERQADEKYRELQNSKTILEKSYQEGKLLEKIQREIQISEDFSNILNISLQSVCTKFDFKRAFIMLKDDQAHDLRTSSVYGDENSLLEIWNFKVDVSQKRDNPLVISSAFHSGQSILINEVQKHKSQLNTASQRLIDKLETSGFAIVPIPSENSNWGVLIADKGKSGDLITRRDLVALQRICQSIGLALDKKAKIESEVRIRRIFQKYVPSAVVEQTLGQSEPKLGGETREATCLFLDIRNFTQLSTQVPSVLLVDLLNKIFSLLQAEATRTGGVIDKYLGDGALVTWGAIPGSDPHSHLAIQCALQFLQALNTLNEDIVKMGMRPVEVGMGIHKGPVIAGNIGSQDRIEFTVIGSTVNLASRLEQLTKVFKCHLVVTEKVTDFSSLDSQWTVHRDIQVRGIDSKINVAAFSNLPPKDQNRFSA